MRTIARDVAARLPARCRVLEIGCGTGNTLRVLRETFSPDSLVVGVDLFQEGLAYARRRIAVPLVCARIEQPPFAVPFDLVGMFDVLEHIDDDGAGLREVRRLTTPGGYFMVTVPAHRALWSQFDEESHHCRRYEPDELRERLTAAGFAVEYLTPFMSTLYPIVRLSRWLSGIANRTRRSLGRDPTPIIQHDLSVRPVIDDIIGFVLRQETVALRRRLQLPIGTSLLALARAT